MSTDQMAPELFLAGATCIAATCASIFLPRKPFIGALLSGIAASTVFQLIDFLRTGFLDAFWPIAFAVTLVISSIGAACIMLPVAAFKKWKNQRKKLGK